MLAALGEVWESIPAPGLTGVLDDATADSLSAFQLLCGLPAAGDLDKITWKHLVLQYPLCTNLAAVPDGVLQNMDKI